MIRLLLVIVYGFRYIYWAFLEFVSAMGKKVKAQGTVESATFEHGPLGLDQVRVRYKYSVNGRSYSGFFIRECSRRYTAPLLQRFPVGGAVWVRVDGSRPNRSHLPSGLGYSGALLAIVPLTALALLWAVWVHEVIMRRRADPAAQPKIAATDCPAGLPGTPESVTNESDRQVRKDLIRYKSKEGEFSILFPSQPQRQEIESISTPYGALHLHRATTETSDGYYEASYGDVPGQGPIDAAAWLSSSGNARLERSSLIDRHDVRLNELPGNAYTAASDQYYWSERIYFVGRRFYRISIYMPRSG